MDNLLTFPANQRAQATAFMHSLKGDAVISEDKPGDEVQVCFTTQRVGDQITYFARLPDGVVVQRRSKRPLGCLVAVIESRSLIARVTFAIWEKAESEHRVAKKTAVLPMPDGKIEHWAEARRICDEFKTSAEYAAHKVRQRDIKAAWGAMSWRTNHFIGNRYAAQLRTEDRWESVVVLDAVGGK
ncbi:hypothetical protein GIW05_00650 [Pseudomonas syringae]|uniref:hypothetical protein n=1 Tax=Pseudomonas syringae TaxID=317 RepID=UPI001F2449B3|nr:hypothetical protein [Pseudomonas syringae]MCF5382030.1 hypothetical protein [Pseudomonas syringae]MCF5419437.1 hypothetical protein [Pseudomonas syringae]MCF5451983.1 hypothetical protein [Pseudomonas syringae]MCF5456270.1 hypothetical protein [Pseudomonas syringae]